MASSNSHASKLQDKASTMNLAYNNFSHNQLAAHRMTLSALRGCVERLCIRRIESAESGDDGSVDYGNRTRNTPIQICDLGCAGGANSVELVKEVLRYLDEFGKPESEDDTTSLETNDSSRFPVTCHFEDLVSNDWNQVAKTLADAFGCGVSEESSTNGTSSYFNRSNFFYTMIAKSFYEQLFPESTIDLSLSYICLHWMSENCPGKTRETNFGLSKSNYKNWVSINEAHVPEGIFNKWQKVAVDDMVRFLKQRGKEMKDHAEGVFMFVGGDGVHETMQPPCSSAERMAGVKPSSLFTQAFEHAIANNELPTSVFDTVCIPYFLRREADVRDSFENVEIVELFECLEVKSVTLACGTTGDVSEIAGMMWSIHENCLATSAGVSVEELRGTVKKYFDKIMAENFPEGVQRATYCYCVVKRKPRQLAIL